MLHVALVRSHGRSRHPQLGRHQRGRVDARRGRRVPCRQRPGLAGDAGLPDVAARLQPADLRQRAGAIRRRRDRRRGRRIAGTGRRRRRGRSFADIDPLPVVLSAADGLAPDAPLLFPETGSNVCFATEFGKDGGDPCEGADAVAEVTMVSQRLAGVPMENNGVVAVPEDGGLTMWVSHQAPHSIHGAYAPMLGLEPGSAAHRLPVGRRRVRPEGRRLRRAPDRGEGRADARQAREVGREPLRGHGVAGARPRLRHDRPAGREQRRQDRRPRLPR